MNPDPYPREMRRRADLALLLALLAATVVAFAVMSGCATLAPGADPVVVRAQDVLADGAAFLESAIPWHKAHSRSESPTVYKVMEVVRTQAPPALATLRAALPAYTAVRDAIAAKDQAKVTPEDLQALADYQAKLSKAADEVVALVSQLRAVWMPGGGA